MITKIVTGIAAAAAIGVAYLSYQNWQAKIVMKADLVQTRDTLDTTQKTLKKTEDELGTTQKNLTAKTEEATKLSGELSSTKSELSSTKSKLETAEREKAALEVSAKDAKDKLEKLETQLAGRSPEQMEADAKEAKAKVAELDTQIKQKEDEIAKLQGQVQKFEEMEAQRRKGISPPGTTGKIVAINGQWNFVVLNVGSKDNVVENSQFTVMRGSKPVGTIKIAQVDENTAVADILKTVDKTVSPAIGDTVLSN